MLKLAPCFFKAVKVVRVVQLCISCSLILKIVNYVLFFLKRHENRNWSGVKFTTSADCKIRFLACLLGLNYRQYVLVFVFFFKPDCSHLSHLGFDLQTDSLLMFLIYDLKQA